jgi:hypothetical protein
MVTYGGQTVIADTQPINGFFNQVKNLTEFITPDNPTVKELAKTLTAQNDTRKTIYNCWSWVANKIRYVLSTSATLTMPVATDGKVRYKSHRIDDCWTEPSLTIRARVGNCFNKSAVLVSLLSNVVPSDKVSLVIGNITNHGIDGHAWTVVEVDGETYLLEGTRPDIKNPFVIASEAKLYDPIIFVNNREIRYIPTKKVKEPLGYCCLEFLSDYLNHALCSSYV